MCDKAFNSIVNNPDHQLDALLPTSNANPRYSLRDNRAFHIPTGKTNRLKKSFIIASVSMTQTLIS